ncbi:MAG: cupin domain-containing protein [Alphaproteobacteria bacterium]|nr:cupin domain-containing protein [Alphaproteobacteria bacterium]
MSTRENFYSLDRLDEGISRALTDGIDASIFPADQSMASVVRIGPGAVGTVHSHPQEQWSILIEGSATRLQGGEEIPVKKGDFWVAPGGVEHGIIGGPEGALIIDIFAPARPEYKKPGSGFAGQ